MHSLFSRVKAPAFPTAFLERAVGGVVSGQATSTTGSPELEAALRRITQSTYASVPTEALEEVVRLVRASEEDLAVVLRHLEKSAGASGKEWRKVHGALVLLERLLRPRLPGSVEGALLGRTWFEVKMERRLATLVKFEYPDDPRVAVLVRRAATTAQQSSECHAAFLDEGDSDEDAELPDSCSDSVPMTKGSPMRSPREDATPHGTPNSTPRSPAIKAVLPPVVDGWALKEAVAQATVVGRQASDVDWLGTNSVLSPPSPPQRSGPEPGLYTPDDSDSPRPQRRDSAGTCAAASADAAAAAARQKSAVSALDKLNDVRTLRAGGAQEKGSSKPMGKERGSASEGESLQSPGGPPGLLRRVFCCCNRRRAGGYLPAGTDELSCPSESDGQGV